MLLSLTPTWSALRHGMFVASLATLLATQSRGLMGGIGVGELAGAAFVVLTLQLRRGLPSSMRLSLVVFLTGFVVGATINQFTGLSNQLAIRDLAAIAFALMYGAATVTHLRQRTDPMVDLANALTAAVLIQVTPLLLFLAGIETNAWLSDTDEPGLPFLSRYIGLADNPNQLGILLCAYPFIAIGALRPGRPIWLIFGLIVGLALAALARSNTVFAAYILGLALWAVLRINRWGSDAAGRLHLWRVIATLVVALPAVVAFGLYANESIDKTGDADANGRFQLWTHAVDGIVQSGLMGVGPGGQSGDRAPFDGGEAHNIWLDVALQGGVLSLLAYAAIVAGSVLRVVRTRSILAACVVAAVLTQQVAHYTARQPIAWVYLLLPFALVSGRARNDLLRHADAPNRQHQTPAASS